MMRRVVADIISIIIVNIVIVDHRIPIVIDLDPCVVITATIPCDHTVADRILDRLRSIKIRIYSYTT